LNKGKIVLIVVAILVCVTIGFVAGQVVQAMTALPGSSDDPVATESYVETTIGERMATLSTKVDELEAEVAALKGEAPAASNDNESSSNENDNSSEATSGESVTITGNGVNLRSAASTNGDVITTLSKGTKVTKIGEEGDWYEVETSSGQTGYVSSSYAE
jgi:outer membrane murein-binding lipoprotein Lpp